MGRSQFKHSPWQNNKVNEQTAKVEKKRQARKLEETLFLVLKMFVIIHLTERSLFCKTVMVVACVCVTMYVVVLQELL